MNCELNNGQEWTGLSDIKRDEGDEKEILEHSILVGFCTDIYGTFRQSVVFDIGSEPVLVKHLCVDVIPVTDADKIKEIKKVCSCIMHFFYIFNLSRVRKNE